MHTQAREQHVRNCRNKQQLQAAASASFCTVVLDVGGHIFKTTEETLRSVKDSRLCHMLGQAESQAVGTKNLFIDRDGKVSTPVCCSCLPFMYCLLSGMFAGFCFHFGVFEVLQSNRR